MEDRQNENQAMQIWYQKKTHTKQIWLSDNIKMINERVGAQRETDKKQAKEPVVSQRNSTRNKKKQRQPHE